MSSEISVRETALNLSHQINLHLYILTVYLWEVIRILRLWGDLGKDNFKYGFLKKITFYLEIISGITEKLQLFPIYLSHIS